MTEKSKFTPAMKKIMSKKENQLIVTSLLVVKNLMDKVEYSKKDWKDKELLVIVDHHFKSHRADLMVELTSLYNDKEVSTRAIIEAKPDSDDNNASFFIQHGYMFFRFDQKFIQENTIDIGPAVLKNMRKRSQTKLGYPAAQSKLRAVANNQG